MINFWRRGLFRQTWHPTFEELMLCLDGEIGPSSARVEAHLRNCWSCRSRREKIDRAIATFMEVRSASFADSPKFPSNALAVFEGKLDHLESEKGHPSFLRTTLRSVLAGLFPVRPSLRFVSFALVLALIACLLVRIASAPPVSAKEVLNRVRRAEIQRLSEVPAPVLYEKIRIQRRSANGPAESLVLEIWNDTRNRRVRKQVDGSNELLRLPMQARPEMSLPAPTTKTSGSQPVGSSIHGNEIPKALSVFDELEQVFVGYHADLAQPLSAGNYEVWRQSMDRPPEEVFEGRLSNGEQTVILKSSGKGPFFRNAIVSAALTVRQRDWHPVEQQLQVQNEDGVVNYTMGELSCNVLALNTLPLSLFADRTTDPPALMVPPPLLHPPLADQLETMSPVTDADLRASEVEAQYALHSVGVCLGRPISVKRTASEKIELQGMVETEETKAQLLAALRGIPHLICTIRTVAETVPAETFEAESMIETLPDQTLSPPEKALRADRSSPKLATEDLLETYFALEKCRGTAQESSNLCVEQNIALLSQNALTASEAALTQGWALRQLCEWYASHERKALRTSTRRLVQLMVEDHLNALKVNLGRVDTTLGPFLLSVKKDLQWERRTPPGNSAPVAVDSEDWSAAALRLCADVEQTMNLTLGMFVETNRPVAQREEALKRLSSGFSDLDARFSNLETKVTRGFADAPQFGSLKPKSE
jgi:hypothetical protein